MTVEEIRGVVAGNNEIDKFPIGMRVLAVDDDPTCLKLLDGLLRKCQYQVTTTNQAITALKMLKENRNKFDLVISDVYMPDMDGFKLLELVGLEMDLPVIMLSGNSDPKLVMKGITHGACDYLVKPVRLEELRNIWQHVIRRKVESKPQSKSNNNHEKSNEGGDQQNVKVNRKRKDEDEDVDEENGHESDDDDDQSSQKKPRVVWSIDLHRKFVAAVNQLGNEKAVPRRILDLMNVDGLTRENVASHLQKYRLYIKRISHQANFFGGSKDMSYYMRTSPLEGFGDFRMLSSSGRLSNAGYAPSGVLGRLNSATGVTLHSLNTAPPLVQPNHTQNKLHSVNHQNMNLFQEIPSSFDQCSNNKPNTQLTDFSSIEESRIYTGTKLADFNSTDESRIFTGSNPFTDPSVMLGSKPSLKESFNLLSSSSNFLDQNGNQPSNFSSNQLPIGENYGCSATTAAIPLEAQGGGSVDEIVQNVNNQSLSNQKNGQYSKQDYSQYSQNAFSTLASLALASGGGGLSGPLSHGGLNGGTSNLFKTQMPSLETKMRSSEDGHVVNNGYGSLDDLVTGMMKRDQEARMMTDSEFGYDPYAFGPCA